MRDDRSIAALESLDARFREKRLDSSVRGESDGSFLYCCHSGRAVEASMNDGKWWIEFWDRSEDPDALAVKECTVTSVDEVFQLICDWLTPEEE